MDFDLQSFICDFKDLVTNMSTRIEQIYSNFSAVELYETNERINYLLQDMQVLIDGVSRLIDNEVINLDVEEFNFYLNNMLTELENENVSTVCDILYFEINPLLNEMKKELQ